MRFKTLPEWLEWQEQLHFTEVDPGLARIGHVWKSLEGTSRLPFTVITVAGTNGKGSSVALLESILRHAGYKTGTYTSPHILRYNERINVNGEACDDTDICQAFEQIDTARADTSLTYFEFATLAAIEIFCKEKIDIAILEVGMGGRLDAVNLFDTDIALITPISLDHTNWLGTNREDIGFEKAGIISVNKPVVCSEQPPQSVIAHAASLQSKLYIANHDFKVVSTSDDCWQWTNGETEYLNLPKPALEGAYQLQNAAAVLQVISLLNGKDYAVSEASINKGLSNVKLEGRFQRIAGDVEVILDVTHNQQGATNLAKLLDEIACKGRTFAVVGILKDKDAAMIASILKNEIDDWYAASLVGDRGMSSQQLVSQFEDKVEPERVKQFNSVESAFQQAMKMAKKGDRILVFGSFHTVESVLRIIKKDTK